MHIIWMCVEAILMGAPHVIEGIPPTLGAVMFWLGVAGLILYPAWQVWENRGWLRARMEPYHVIWIGAAGVVIFAVITAIGAVWQHQAPSLPEIDQSSATSSHSVEQPPSRHYSAADKDRLSEAFHQLRETLNEQADPLQLEVQKIWQEWSRREAARTDQPVDVERTIGQVANVRAEAARLSDVIFNDWLKANASYEPLLRSVLDYRIPDPFRELYQHADRIGGALRSAKTLYQEAPDKPHDIATVALRILEPFAETNGRLNGWIHETLRRIEEQEKLVLSEGRPNVAR